MGDYEDYASRVGEGQTSNRRDYVSQRFADREGGEKKGMIWSETSTDNWERRDK